MNDVIAPMPGMILEVMIKVGDEVQEDQELIILEAMKMENPIFSPSSGKVKSINIKEGDNVESDDILLILE